MAEKKVIAASLQLDVGSSNTNLKEFNKNVNEVKTSLKETGTVAKKTGDEVEGSGKSFGNLKDKIAGMPGPLGQAGEGVNKLSSTFKALLANPIVLLITLIVGALALLYKAFTSTEAGADKMEQTFAGVGAAVDVIRDRILVAAGAIAKFFSGDFKGAMQDARAAVSGIGAEIAKEFNQAADAAKRLQEIDDVVRELGVSRAKLNRDLAATKEILTDENATLAEKRAAIEAVRIAEGKQTEQELANARNLLQVIKEKNALSDTSEEDQQKEADAQAAIYALEQKSASDNRSLNKQSRAIEKEANAKAAAEARENEAERKRLAAESLAAKKEEAAKLKAFNDQLRALREGNALAAVKDSYERELLALQQKNIKEREIIAQSIISKGLTTEQGRQLERQLDEKFYLETVAIEEKRAAEKKAEADKKAKAEEEATKLRLAAAKKAIDKQFTDEIEKNDKVLKDPLAELAEKQAALDAEVIAVQNAFDAKAISEEAYTEKTKELANARMQLDKAEADAKKSAFTEVGNAFSTLSTLVGKQTALGKGFAIAAATIATIQSAVSSFNSLSGIPIVGPALGAIAAAGAIAAGIANVKKIVAVQVPGGAGGGSTPNIAVPSAPIAPAAGTTTLDRDSINGVGNAASGKVFVLESDVSSNQERLTRLARASRLGGVLVFMLFAAQIYQLAYFQA